MKLPKQFFKNLVVSAWYVFATLVVLVAILFGSARLLLPYVSDYTQDISARVSEYLGQPVRVESLNAEWHELWPALVLEDVALLGAEAEKPVLEFSRARLEFNIIKSLIFLRPELSNITLVGVDLVLTRDKTGRFSLAGIEGKSEAKDLDFVTAWIGSQGKIRLEKSNVTWHDEMGEGRDLRFSSINLTLRNSGRRHVLDASVDLPKSLGESLSFHVDLRGDLFDAKGRRATAYFKGEKLQFTEFLQTQSIAGISANVGEADFQIWLRWENAALQRLEGEVDVDDVSLFAIKPLKSSPAKNVVQPKSLDLKRLAGRFRWLNNPKGWLFDGSELVLEKDNPLLLPARASVSVKNGAGTLQSIDAYASHLQLEVAAQLLDLFSVGGDAVRIPLEAIKPRGMVHDARFAWQNGESPVYKAYARLERASTNAWKFIPATNQMHGQLWLEKNSGQAVLEKGAVTLDFPNLFRWPIEVAELSGQIDWAIDGDKWRFTGKELIARNEDISSNGSFNVVKDQAGKSPFMSLAARFEDGDGSQVARYLPTGIMPQTAVEWLDTAIVGGNVVSGGTIMHGRLSDFPYDKGDGKFEVRFSVEDGRLDYAKGWPTISEISADVQFIGKSMSIDANKGKIYSNEIQWAKVELPNMTVMPMSLLVNGEISGSTQDKLKYLVKSPELNESFGQYLEDITSDGESMLHLDLDLPIGNYKDVSVKGWVDLDNNSLAMPPLGRILSKVKGRLEFQQDGLSMDAVHADLFGQPTDLKVLTETQNGDKWIRIKAKGLFDAKEMAASYLSTVSEHVSGTGDLDVLFNIPLGDDNQSERIANLIVASNFKGVEMRLPSPFTKQAEEVASLDLEVDFMPGGDPILRAAYGNFINVALAFNDEAVAGLRKGEVRVNSGSASLPKDDGLRIIGWLDNVKLNDWLDLWPADYKLPVDQDAGIALFQNMDMAIGNLQAYGQDLHNVRIVAVPTENTWRLDISSDEVVGLVKIPPGLSVNSIEANFDYIYLSEPQLTEGEMDPRNVPPLDVQVDDLRYESRQFGKLRLETTRVANGVRIEQIVLNPKATSIVASGGWYISGAGHNSSIQAHIKSSDVGKTLKELGYVGAVAGGEGEADLQLRWPRAFHDVEVSQVNGSMNMSLKNGQLLEIDPGAGRLFGMLSLQTLPRRLFLDFSDVFSKGFGFDSIKGAFNIEDGNAYTKNLKLDGPAAKIEIKGRVGLAQQDYDQTVTVTPRVSESLPVIGALTSTPQVGAVILFFQKIFQPGIEEATKNQYTITGKWNDPIIKKVKSFQTENPSFEDGASQVQ